MHKKGKVFIFAFLVLLIGFVVFIQSLSPPRSQQGLEAVFHVRKGEGLFSVADRLANEGRIRSSSSFKLLGAISGGTEQIRPGAYHIDPTMSVPKIIDALVNGSNDIQVRIIEGDTIREVDQKLADHGVIRAGDFLSYPAPLEGFLFPDTYFFSENSDEWDVLNIFLKNFSAKLKEAGANPGTVQGLISCVAPETAYSDLGFEGCIGLDENREMLYHRLVVASILEKEIFFSEEMPTVAGVLDTRLEIGMALQVDASVRYAVCEGVFRKCGTLTREDYKMASPYNSYLHPGLPPTPISNPGSGALYAALHPENSDYLYYLSDPETKKTIFSTNFDEHTEKRAKYLGL